MNPGPKLFNLLNLGLESVAAPTNMETEIAIFAKIGNPEGFKEASHVEHHEQLEGNYATQGRCRCRKITIGDTVTYEHTIKIPYGDAGAGVKSVKEVTEPVSEEFYEQFRKVAEKMLRKTRYVFQSENSTVKLDDQESQLPPPKYEVDVFEKPDGTTSEWVKIDVELDNILAFLNNTPNGEKEYGLTVKVSHLPFEPKGSFICGQATPEQKELMDRIWNTEFRLSPIPVDPNAEPSEDPNAEPVEEPTATPPSGAGDGG